MHYVNKMSGGEPMNIKNLKWPVVILSFALCLLVFFGVHYLRQKQFIEEPLAQALEAMEEVQGVELKNRGGQLEIALTITRLEDFPLFYERVERAVCELYKGDYTLEFKDNPGPEVQAAYRKIHLALFEAAAQGNFVAMGRHVEEVGAAYGLETCRVLVTEEYMYLELTKDEGYLYRRFNRQPAKGEEAV